VGAARGSLVNSWWMGSGYSRWHGRWVGGSVELLSDSPVPPNSTTSNCKFLIHGRLLFKTFCIKCAGGMFSASAFGRLYSYHRSTPSLVEALFSCILLFHRRSQAGAGGDNAPHSYTKHICSVGGF